MSSLTGISNTVAGSSAAGYGLFNQLQRALPGDQSRVVFLRDNKAEVQFDCCLTESHAYQATPTSFPIESSAMVSDHIQSAPIQIQLTGVIADHPPETEEALFAAGVSAVASASTQQLGAIGTLGGTVGYASLASAVMAADSESKGPSLSRSAAVYATLRRLAGFSQVDDGSDARQAMPADVVDVVTAKLGKKFVRFPSMAIVSLEMQRDNSVGSRALVFSIAMSEMRRVYRETEIVSVAIPEKQQPKKQAKAKEEDQTDSYAKELEDGNSYLAKTFKPIVGFVDSLNE